MHSSNGAGGGSAGNSADKPPADKDGEFRGLANNEKQFMNAS